MSSIIDKALQVLSKYSLCDHCLGRLFAKLGYGLENAERGRAIKNLALMKLHEELLKCESDDDRKRIIKQICRIAVTGHEAAIKFLKNFNINVQIEKCYICESRIFNNIDKLVDLALIEIEKSGIVFKKFHVGTTLPREVLKRELDLTLEFNIDTAESIKRELNRVLGKMIRRRLGKHVEVDTSNPDIVIIIDPLQETVNLEVKPQYILTRYRKLTRAISQAQIYKNVITSIERELEKLKNATSCSEVIIHASGREDIDARMLGSGRPTIIEISKPIRRLELDDLSKLLESTHEFIEFSKTPTLTSSREVRKLKKASERDVKIYRVLTILDNDVSDEQLVSLENYFRNRQVTQYIPRRIKRKPKWRKRVKMIYELKVHKVCERVLELLIKCQGGLYVKEFITSDEGRTEPSIAGTLGVNAYPVELDVLDVLEVP